MASAQEDAFNEGDKILREPDPTAISLASLEVSVSDNHENTNKVGGIITTAAVSCPPFQIDCHKSQPKNFVKIKKTQQGG